MVLLLFSLNPFPKLSTTFSVFLTRDIPLPYVGLPVKRLWNGWVYSAPVKVWEQGVGNCFWYLTSRWKNFRPHLLEVMDGHQQMANGSEVWASVGMRRHHIRGGLVAVGYPLAFKRKMSCSHSVDDLSRVKEAYQNPWSLRMWLRWWTSSPVKYIHG